MSNLSELTDLVRRSRMDAVFQKDVTIHKLLRNRGGLQRHETWIKEKKIGHGGFGEVWLERKWIDTRGTGQVEVELRAVKCIHVSSQRRAYMRELEALATFSSNSNKYAGFFVQFYGWYESTEWLHAAMEYCERGDLRDYLKRKDKIPEDEVQEITRQILGGVSLMHEAGFAHRDIKPANILIKAAPPSAWWVKIGDLGLSKRAEAIGGSTTSRATPGFIPPELLGFIGEDSKNADHFLSDSWCVGETGFQALTGQATFPDYGRLIQYVKGDTNFPHETLQQVQVSEDCIELIRSLMAPLPPDRLSAAKALKHPWMTTEDDAKSLAEHVASLRASCGSQKPDLHDSDEITQPATQWTTDTEKSHTIGIVRDQQNGLREFEGAVQPASDPRQHTRQDLPKVYDARFRNHLAGENCADQHCYTTEDRKEHANKAVSEKVVSKQQEKVSTATPKKYLIRKKGRTFHLDDSSHIDVISNAASKTGTRESIKVMGGATFIPNYCISRRAISDSRYEFQEGDDGICIFKLLEKEEIEELLRIDSVHQKDPLPPLAKKSPSQVPVDYVLRLWKARPSPH